MEFVSSSGQIKVDGKMSSARYRCLLSPRESTVSSEEAAKALTRTWNEQAAVAGGVDAGFPLAAVRVNQRRRTLSPARLSLVSRKTRSPYISMVALVGPYCSPSRRS